MVFIVCNLPFLFYRAVGQSAGDFVLDHTEENDGGENHNGAGRHHGAPVENIRALQGLDRHRQGGLGRACLLYTSRCV